MTATTELTITDAIIEYVLANHVSPYKQDTLPRDQSLLELGVLDSYGIVELVAFLESNWSIRILDAEITREKMGSIEKMARLVAEKLKI
jgi:acyl carrier protein